MKKIISLIICLACLAALCPFTASANTETVVGGECGDGVFWSYDTEDRALTIGGTGAMYDYDDCFDTPWYDYLGVIRDVSVEEGVTHVGDNAFLWAKSMRGLLLAESVKSVGDYAFAKCINLYLLSGVENVTSFGEGAFFMCGRIADLGIADGVEVIPAKAFGQCEALRGVVIPGSVRSIGEEAFMDCTSVLYADIKDGAEEIGSHSFAFCSSLNTVHIPKSVNKIEKFAFSHCDALEDVYFGGTCEEWESIVEYGEGDDSLKNAVVHFETDEFLIHGPCGDGAAWEYSASGKRLSILGTGAMYRYDDYSGAPWKDFDIEKIVIGDGISSIGTMAFFGTKGLLSVEMSDTVTEIESAAFGFCRTLEGIRLSRSLEVIGGGALASCSSLSFLAIPASTTSIDPTALAGLSGLSSIAIDGENPVYYAENDCIIERGTKRLVSITATGTIPNDGSVTTIGARAFAAKEDITEVYIPKAVTYVEAFAFCDCPLIADVYFEGTKEEWEDLKESSPSGEFEGNNTFFDAAIHFESKLISKVAGDANGDGKATMKDVLLLRKALAGVDTIDKDHMRNADFNGDGKVTMKDVLALRKHLAGIKD